MRTTPLRRLTCGALMAAVGYLPAHAADITAERAALFAYDAAADFSLATRGTESRGAAEVADVSFVAVPGAGSAEARVDAYVVAPRGATVGAGVLWVHWLGEPSTTNRTQFLDEAVALAERGVVSVLVDAMWSKPNWYRDRVLEQDYAQGVGQVIALRRALDLLRAQRGVDAARVGFVAHDYGAMYGTIALALDGRVKTAVLIAATASLNDWAFFAKKPASMEDYLKQNAPLELRDFLGVVRGTSVFMQFAEKDEYVPLDRAEAFFAAANEPKLKAIYPGAGHEMTAPAAIRADRTDWLVDQLVSRERDGSTVAP